MAIGYEIKTNKLIFILNYTLISSLNNLESENVLPNYKCDTHL